MKTKLKKAGTSLMAILLVFVMSFSVALSSLPGMLFDLAGEEADAAVVSGTDDAVYFPITLRDAKPDKYYFGSNNIYELNDYVHLASVLGQNKNEIYQHDSITGLAGILANPDRYGYLDEGSNESLKIALKNQIKNKTTTSQSSGYNGTFKSIYNYYDAAKWYLDNMYGDGTLNDAPAEDVNGNYIDNNLFMKKVPEYESLVLKKKVAESSSENVFGRSTYYYFKSDDLTKLDKENRTIMNATAEEGGQSYVVNGSGGLSGGFHPLNGLGFGDQNNEGNSPVNSSFTTVGSGKFVYHKDEDLFFAFKGDDEVFLYINDKLVIKMGGLHDDITCYIDLESQLGNPDGNEYSTISTTKTKNRYTIWGLSGNKTWAEYLGLQEGGIYDFRFYHAERYSYGSNFSIYTNIQLVNPSAVPNKTAYQDGQELAYGAYVAQNSDVTYGFELTNDSEVDSAITYMKFEDDQLGVVLDPGTPANPKSSLSYDLNTAVSGTNLTDLEYAIYSGNAVPVYTKVTSADQLLNVLKTGIGQGETFSIRGFKHNVGTTSVYDNTLETSVWGRAMNSADNVEIKGTANMRIRTSSFANTTFVIDYAEPMTVSKTDVFGTELNGISGVQTITLRNNVGKYGTMALNASNTNNYMIYTPTKFINGTDPFTLNIPVKTTASGKTSISNLAKAVTIIPANNIYYEDDFVSTNNDSTVGIVYTGSWTSQAGQGAAEKHEGAENATNGGVHGWEDNLANDTGSSDGSYHLADANNQGEGQTATATFTFTGTGVDIYGRTNNQTGTVYATLKGTDNNTSISKSLIVDTVSESGEYYHIPTLSFAELNRGTYTVTIKVTKGASSEGRFLYFLDGIRVYNPIDDSDSLVADAYGEKEVNAVFAEVRDLLADTDEANQNNSAVFIDEVDGDTAVTKTYDETEYGLYGPKNEVYLAKGQSITFKVSGTSDNYYYIGLKAPVSGKGTTALISNGSSNATVQINHTTDMYYEAVPTASGSNAYITIKNNGENLLSVTKLRVAGADTNQPVLLLADEEAVEFYAVYRAMPVSDYNGEPVNPDTPDEPDTPDTPDEPDTPDKPEQPSRPNKPIWSNWPSWGNGLNWPSWGNKPSQPNKPDQPETPDNNETQKPETPDEPETPDVEIENPGQDNDDSDTGNGNSNTGNGNTNSGNNNSSNNSFGSLISTLFKGFSKWFR